MFLPSQRLHAYLRTAQPAVLNGYAMFFAFATYFCMYAFRKPFSAAQYSDLHFFGTQIELKTALVISQIIGYASSKAIGIKFCSEATRHRRAWLLIALILCAELALVLFAVVPSNWKVVTIFFNGLPLGMVWGLVVWYLEGRRASEILLAGLSCSFIVSSGVVKDFGRAILAGDPFGFLGMTLPNPFPALSDFWMPAATGLVFLPILLGTVWFLDQLPEPTRQDILARTQRKPMDRNDRRNFLADYWPGILLLLLAYFFLTAFRDYRDNYMVEILNELGYSYDQHKHLISRMEFIVALGVIGSMGILYFISDNRMALMAVLSVMAGGLAMIGVATALRESGALSGVYWMLLIGLGSYLAYVPYNSVLFDRLVASTHVAATSVFTIYLADTMGYSGSIVLQLYKDLMAGDETRLGFMQGYCYFIGATGTVLVAAGGFYFLRRLAPVETFANIEDIEAGLATVPVEATYDA